MRLRWLHFETSSDEVLGVGLLFAFVIFVVALWEPTWWLWLACAGSFAAASPRGRRCNAGGGASGDKCSRRWAGAALVATTFIAT